jgi:hypothetical protein
MNPLLVTLGLRLLKAALAAPKLRKSLTDTIAAEKLDVGPEVVAALSGDAAAIKLLSDQIDEADAYNKALVARLEAQVRAAGTRLDS